VHVYSSGKGDNVEIWVEETGRISQPY